MRRRDFTRALCIAAAWRAVSGGARSAPLPVVGFLNSASADGYASMASAFRDGLKETGYDDGDNVVIEYRWGDNRYDRLPALATDLVNRRVTVIFANAPSIPAAKAATSTIPIIFLTGDDPVRLGYIKSFNRPGGNATGVTIFSGELAAKRLSLLRELVPTARTIAVLINPGWATSARFQAEVEAAARVIGLPLRLLHADSENEIGAAFTTLAQGGAEALLVGPGPFLDSRRELLVAQAAKIKIAAAYETRATAAAGGLMSYGASVEEGYRQAGVYTGRVLNGATPADLPVFQSTKIELVINLKTAKALGLVIPPSLLARADEVIE
jgi:putative ABC transport system substrate-binding protein